MLKVNQIKCPIEHDDEMLMTALVKKLGCSRNDILNYRILKRSVDARKKPALFFQYTLSVKCADERRILKRNAKNHDVSPEDSIPFSISLTGTDRIRRPIIIGAGPAGLFCALELARLGFCPIILERGRDVDRRTKDVEEYWEGKPIDSESNVQFGEGGAGTFSDGKLNTLVKDLTGRNRYVLERLVEFGADPKILYDHKPHIGTDLLKVVVKKIRLQIQELGGEVRFEAKATDFRFDNGRISSVQVNGKEWLDTDIAVLAIGHSARDTFQVLFEHRLTMESKPFAVGFRVIHPQKFINNSQYAAPEIPLLGAAPYKLTAKAEDGRGVYSFCMCPGGYVVNASSEEGRIAVNGMSYSKRDSDCANSAIIVAVTPEDFRKACPDQNGDSPLIGIEFQRKLESNAAKAGGGKIPIQTYGNFVDSMRAKGLDVQAVAANQIEHFEPCIKGLYREGDLTGILPDELNIAFIQGMEEFNRKIHGFADANCYLCGVESRTSSPVRIVRDEELESNQKGIYPCGEGAGYAGGITSAAMDGVKVAAVIAQRYHP